MLRRNFLITLFVAPFIGKVKLPDNIWTFKNGSSIVFEPTIPTSLCGIPYHESNAYIGEWLGITRSPEITDEIVKMVTVLEEDKRKDYVINIPG